MGNIFSFFKNYNKYMILFYNKLIHLEICYNHLNKKIDKVNSINFNNLVDKYNEINNNFINNANDNFLSINQQFTIINNNLNSINKSLDQLKLHIERRHKPPE